MNNCINLFLLKQSLDSRLIAAIDLIERDILPSGDCLYTIESCHVASRHIICHNDLIARSDEFDCHVTADVAGTTRNQNFLCHSYVY